MNSFGYMMHRGYDNSNLNPHPNTNPAVLQVTNKTWCILTKIKKASSRDKIFASTYETNAIRRGQPKYDQSKASFKLSQMVATAKIKSTSNTNINIDTLKLFNDIKITTNPIHEELVTLVISKNDVTRWGKDLTLDRSIDDIKDPKGKIRMLSSHVLLKKKCTINFPRYCIWIIGVKYENFTYRQCSIRCRSRDDLNNINNIDIMIFHNGSIKICGVPTPISGVNYLRMIIVYIRLILNKPELYISEYVTRNINCKYNVPYMINQEVLFKHLETLELNLFFNRTIYPALMIRYFHNTMYPNNDGKCKCKHKSKTILKPCYNAKGDGDAIGKCRVITAQIHRSGNTLICGARNYIQLQSMINFLEKNFSLLKEKIRTPEFKLIPTDEIT